MKISIHVLFDVSFSFDADLPMALTVKFVDRALSEAVPVVLRQRCFAYLASFLARSMSAGLEYVDRTRSLVLRLAFRQFHAVACAM